MASDSGSKHQRLLHKLLREVTRAEGLAADHAALEGRRLGDVPPTSALREVAAHAEAMRPRLVEMVRGHGLELHRSAFGSRLSALRQRMLDRVVDAEHAFRTAILDLRHGLDLVELLRDVTRNLELFGLVRWSDDWLAARRTLVMGVEARLAWFADAPVRVRGSKGPAHAPRDLGAAASEVRADARTDGCTDARDDAPSAPRSTEPDRRPSSPHHDHP